MDWELMMIILFIICTLICGFMILFGCALAVFSKSQSSEGIPAVTLITAAFLVSYIVLTGMIHIARIYWSLPVLPWEFAL